MTPLFTYNRYDSSGNALNSDDDDAISALERWEVDVKVTRYFSKAFLRSIFNYSDYNIILKHEDHSFLLHESDDLLDSQKAFEVIRSVMGPLMKDVGVVLQSDLLKELPLTGLRDPTQLLFDLEELKDSKVNCSVPWCGHEPHNVCN